MKRVLSLIFVLILSLTLLSACGGESDKPSDNASSSSVADSLQFSTETVKYFNDGGKSNYKIVRPDENEAMFEVSGNVYKTIKDKLQLVIQNTADTSDGTDQYEILIGGTNRPESKFAYDYLVENVGGRFDDYIVCSVGKKIVINGLSDSAIANAAQHFLDNFISGHTVEGGIKYIHKTEGSFTDITVNGTNISKFTMVRPRFNLSYLAQLEMEKIYEYVKQTTGFEVEIVDDHLLKEGDFEIVVGNADRKEVKAFDKNDTDSYSVVINGNKVYLNGGSTYATAMAVSEFLEMLKDGKAENADTVSNGSYASVIGKYDAATYYAPTWLEDFKATELDTTKWMHVPWSADGQNGKKSRRSEETYTFDGEYFTITPYQTETEYHGGMLRTHRDMCYIYGYVEESAKLPTAKGFWTALWTGDTTGFGFYGDEQAAKEQILGNEIDINENFGANYIAANCHSWPTELGESLGYKHTSCDGNEFSNDKKYYPDKGVDLHDDFHTYGMMWTPEYMSFTCDGRVYFTYDTTATDQDVLTFNQKMHLTLSMAVGLKSGATSIGLATEDDWANKSTLVVDYVHLYQLQDGKSVLDLRENTYGN